MTDKPICGYTKKNGKPCESTILLENGRCRVHGTRAKGESHWNYKNGKYSRYAPANELGQLYERAKRDTDLRDLSDDLALTTALINERLASLETMGGIDFFKDLSATAKELRKALAQQDMDEIHHIALVIDGMANKGKDHLSQLDMMLKLIEQRRKLSDSQSKRETEQQQFITVMQAMNLFNMLIVAVFENIQSSRTKQAIYKAVEKIINERLSPTVETLVIPD